jgi:OOP family OmpA-OmpF porin
MKFLLKKIIIASVLLSLAQHASAQTSNSGYAIDGRNAAAKNNFGECWRTGYWTSSMAVSECDPSLVAKPQTPIAQAPKPVEPAPAPVAPAPAPKPAAPVPAPVQRITLSDNVLFDFGKADLKAEGKKSIDQDVIVPIRRFKSLDKVVVNGYTDRIGSKQANQALSERRASAVADYIASQGIDKSKVEARGQGPNDPIVACNKIKDRKKLIACLQTNRRVVIDIRGEREVK